MDIFEKYESDLLDRLVELSTARGLLDGMLLSTPDITARWEPIALEYSGDAVREFNGYPEVVLAWTAYIGMAVACWWTGIGSGTKTKDIHRWSAPEDSMTWTST